MNIENKLQQSESLFELISILGSQHDYSEILRIISSKIAEMFYTELVSITMINPVTLSTIRTIEKIERDTKKTEYDFVKTNIIGWVMINKQSFLSEELSSDSRFREGFFNDVEISSAMCVPILHADSIFGHITVISKNEKYGDEQLQLLERISTISVPYLNNVKSIQEYFNVPLPKEVLLEKYKKFGLLGKSKIFIELLQSIEAAARCDVRILLEGETGTGKELVARAIHSLSTRFKHPFIAIDCGAIPPNLVESEFFGHVKGAFTGADKNRKGLFAEANKGTLFLDEIENLSMEMQTKLMRVLEDSNIRAVGSNQYEKIDVRLISASSRSISKLVEEKQFREDLYYRLLVYPIHVANLEERKSDIPLLANHFLIKFSEKQNKKITVISREITEYLKFKTWSGNIRELSNFVERLVTFAPDDVENLNISFLPGNLKEEINIFLESRKITEPPSLNDSLQNFEKELILKALEDNDWNQTKAARSLDIPEQTLRFKMKKLGIVKPER